jgi:alginate O-acetyltransferase complex protein AlgI
VTRLWPPLAHAYALVAIAFGWVLFRCTSFEHAGFYLKALAGLGAATGEMNPLERFLDHGVILALAAGVVCATPVLAIAERWLEGHAWAAPLRSVAAMIVLALAALGVANSTYMPFIYFRF